MPVDLLAEIKKGKEEAAAPGRKLRTKAREWLTKQEDALSTSPKHDILGPAASTAVSFVKDQVPDPADDPEFPFPMLGGGTVRGLGKQLAKVRGLADDQAIDLMGKLAKGKRLPDNMSGSDARALFRDYVTGKHKEFNSRLDALWQASSQPKIKRTVLRGPDGASSGSQPSPEIDVDNAWEPLL